MEIEYPREKSAQAQERNDVTEDIASRQSHRNPGMIVLTIGLCLGVFLLSIDRTIVAIAVPSITDQFHSFADVGWYGSAYLISVCAVQPLFGQAYGFFSTKWIYISSFAIFEVGSLVCATTPDSLGLIIGRAIAGCGAGGVLSGSYVIVAQTIPLQIRPIYTAAVSMMFSIGAIAAPLIGGALTEHVNWRWLFYINLPIGLPVLLGMVFLFNPPNNADTIDSGNTISKIKSLDLPGAALLLGATIMLFLALQYAADGTPWNSALVIGLLVGSGTITAVFFAWQYARAEHALMVPRILKQRTVLASAIANTVMYAALVAYIYFLVIYFQVVYDAGIVRSAVDMLPLIVSCSVFSIVAGILVSKIGYFAPPAIAGTAIATVGAALTTTLHGSVPTARWAGFEILLGVGWGLALQQGFFGVQAVLPASDIPAATSLITFCQSLGGALGSSVGNAVLLTALRGARHRLAKVGVDIDEVIRSGATGFRGFVFNNALLSLIDEYGRALNQVFIMASVAAGLAFVACCSMEMRKIVEPAASSESENKALSH